MLSLCSCKSTVYTVKERGKNTISQMVSILKKATLQFLDFRSRYTKQYMQNCTLNIETFSWNGDGDEKRSSGWWNGLGTSPGNIHNHHIFRRMLVSFILSITLMVTRMRLQILCCQELLGLLWMAIQHCEITLLMKMSLRLLLFWPYCYLQFSLLQMVTHGWCLSNVSKISLTFS